MKQIPKNVKFVHCRNISDDGQVQPTGGMTVAYVLNEKFKVVGWAAAKCHNHDHFVKHTGRAKAAGRLNSGHYYTECPEMDEKAFIEDTINGYKKAFA